MCIRDRVVLALIIAVILNKNLKGINFIRTVYYIPSLLSGSVAVAILWKEMCIRDRIHMVQALEDIKAAGCNALVVYLGNFGPEISETLLAKHFDGPKMFVAAAEERGDNLIQGLSLIPI